MYAFGKHVFFICKSCPGMRLPYLLQMRFWDLVCPTPKPSFGWLGTGDLNQWFLRVNAKPLPNLQTTKARVQTKGWGSEKKAGPAPELLKKNQTDSWSFQHDWKESAMNRNHAGFHKVRGRSFLEGTSCFPWFKGKSKRKPILGAPLF